MAYPPAQRALELLGIGGHRAFGTAHMPGHWPRRYGTVKFQPPEDWVGQLLYPFRRRRESTPYG